MTIKILEQVGLTFDDLLLVPRFSPIEIRFCKDISLAVELLPDICLKYPLVSANMDTVTGMRLAGAMHDLGGIGIIHRFLDIESHLREIAASPYPRILCIGIGEESLARLRYISNRTEIHGILIDIAHGHSALMNKQIKKIRSECNIPIIAGNVATYEGALSLFNAGASAVKVGIGSGGLCTTRINTDCGVPQLTAICETVRAKEDYILAEKPWFKPRVIADGGIRNSGDIAKALAAGADTVMIGKLFAGTDEAIGEYIISGNTLVKKYRGMASIDAQIDWKGAATSVEGEMTFLPYKGSVKNIFNSLVAGILSGMSYLGAYNLDELRQNAIFIRQTQAGYTESLPHALINK